MKIEKTILIGSDKAANLISILDCVQQSPAYTFRVITASRIEDLKSILKEAKPDLIIANFTDNQLVLNDTSAFVLENTIPILCLNSKEQKNILNWNINAIVFAYPVELIDKESYLINRINSIFLLKNSRSTNNKSSFTSGNDNMSRYVMELDRKKEILSKVKDKIKALYPNVNDPVRNELTSILDFIKASSNDQKLWDDFKFYFEKTHQGFLQVLTEKHPALTPIDLKYCCYLKMNMSNDDIKRILGINQESVRTHTYRLKRKLALAKQEDLRRYLRKVC